MKVITPSVYVFLFLLQGVISDDLHLKTPNSLAGPPPPGPIKSAAPLAQNSKDPTKATFPPVQPAKATLPPVQPTKATLPPVQPTKVGSSPPLLTVPSTKSLSSSLSKQPSVPSSKPSSGAPTSPSTAPFSPGKSSASSASALTSYKKKWTSKRHSTKKAPVTAKKQQTSSKVKKTTKKILTKHTTHKHSTTTPNRTKTTKWGRQSSNSTHSQPRSSLAESQAKTPSYRTRAPARPKSLDMFPSPYDAVPMPGLQTVPSNYTVNYILDIDLISMNSSNYIPNGTLGWVCINHHKEYLLFHPNNSRPASPGLKMLAETGNNTNLTSEFHELLNKRQIGAVFYSPQFKQESPSTTTMTVNVSADFPMISCAARLEPSADWFTGLVNVNLVPNGSGFLEAVQLLLEKYDAGALKSATPHELEYGNVTTVEDSRVRNQIGFVTFGIA